MKISYKKGFIKKYQKLDQKIKNNFQDRLEIFIDSPENILLKNHALTGKFEGYRSINVTGNFRAIFQNIGNGDYDFVEFIDIGTHSQIY